MQKVNEEQQKLNANLYPKEHPLYQDAMTVSVCYQKEKQLLYDYRQQTLNLEKSYLKWYNEFVELNKKLQFRDEQLEQNEKLLQKVNEL